jgi:hypothetical protein
MSDGRSDGMSDGRSDGSSDGSSDGRSDGRSDRGTRVPSEPNLACARLQEHLTRLTGPTVLIILIILIIPIHERERDPELVGEHFD